MEGSVYTHCNVIIIAEFLFAIQFFWILQLGLSVDEQELDNILLVCKDEFKDFENQDLKYREDLKYKKQKIKKVEEKLEKVGRK